MKKDYDGTSFSQILRGLMREQKLTQQGLAEYLNISRQSVSQYLDGSAQPSIDKLYKLAEYFECTADYLLGLSDYKNQKEKSELENLENSEHCLAVLKSINFLIGKFDKDKKERLLFPLRAMFSVLSMYAENIEMANSNYNYLYGNSDGMRMVYDLFDALRDSNVCFDELRRLHINQTQIDGAISFLIEFINTFTLLSFDFEKISKEKGC